MGGPPPPPAVLGTPPQLGHPVRLPHGLASIPPPSAPPPGGPAPPPAGQAHVVVDHALARPGGSSALGQRRACCVSVSLSSPWCGLGRGAVKRPPTPPLPPSLLRGSGDSHCACRFGCPPTSPSLFPRHTLRCPPLPPMVPARASAIAVFTAYAEVVHCVVSQCFAGGGRTSFLPGPSSNDDVGCWNLTTWFLHSAWFFPPPPPP